MSNDADARATSLHITVVVDSAPPVAPGNEYGLQDKDGALHDGETLADGRRAYSCEVAIAESGADDEPRLLGPFVHGPPRGRFLYIGYRRGSGASAQWIRRTKVPLSDITWAAIEAAGDGGLETTVDGATGGSVQATWRPA